MPGVTITVNAETEEAVKRVKEFFSRFGEGLEGVAGAGEFFGELKGKIFAALSVGALVEFGRECINAAESLQRLNSETGFSVRMLSSLREEADKTRGGFEGVQGSLGMFANRLGEAVRVGGQAAKGFRELIGVEALAEFASGGKQIDDVLVQVTAALNKMPEGAAKANLAMELFGRSGREVLPVLSRIRGEMEEGMISPEMAAEASAFNIGLREMKDEFQKIGFQVMKVLLPSLNSLVAWLRSSNEEFGVMNQVAHWVAEAVKYLVMGLIAAAEYGAAAIGELVDRLKLAWDAFMELGRVAAAVAMIMWDALNLHPIKALQGFRDMIKGATKDLVEMGNAYSKSVDARWRTADARTSAAFLRALSGGPGSSGGTVGGPRPTQSGATTVQTSQEAEGLLKEVARQWAEATKGKLALLDEEREQLIAKLSEEVLDQQKQEDAILKVVETYGKKREELLRQQADAEREIELARVQGRRHLLEQDPTLTEMERKEAMLVLLKRENVLLDENITLLERRVRDLNLTPEERMTASKQLQDTRTKKADNSLQISNVGRKGTFLGEMDMAVTGLLEEWGSMASQVANVFKKSFESAISSISQGITGLIMGTKTWRETLIDVYNSLATSFVQVVSEMVVRWVLSHALMLITGRLFRTTEVVEHGVATGEKVAAHAAGEGAMTGFSFLGSLARGAIRLGETIFHGIQIGIRVAAHLVGELLMTGVVLVQSAIRIGQILIEALAYLIMAAIGAASAEASIPYVGPILAIAAIAAILAVGGALIAGAFAEGGDPPVGRMSLVGERGPELFVPRTSGTILPADVTSAVLSGRGGGGGPAGGTQIQIAVLNEESQVPNWARSTNGEQHIVDVVRRNWSRVS